MAKYDQNQLTLEDQDFLKELGISGMAPGLEFALRQQREALEARKRIERNADGLQPLHLDDETLVALALEKGVDPDRLRDKLHWFRDLDNEEL